MQRFHQVLLVVSILWLSWLIMMLVHESGHVLAALCTGGNVRRVVWHPAAISRTDVDPNPHPLIEISAGPVIGSIVPLIAAGVASAFRLRFAYLVWVVAGFCLIANGAYIGIGAIRPTGDAAELLAHGMPRWPMVVYGIIGFALGFWMWHRVSPRLGFGSSPLPVCTTHAYASFAAAVILTAVSFAVGDRSV